MEPVERTTYVRLAADLSPEAKSRAFAAFARQGLEAEQAKQRAFSGRELPFEQYVDGRQGAPLESVRPNGVIMFEFELVLDVLRWIGDMLVQNSPVLTGRYQDSHVMFADGVQVDIDTAPGMVPPAQEYVFLNVQPYARLIELGWSDQTPDGVYQGVASMAQRRFGNVAKIRFTYRVPLTHTNMSKAAQRDARQPAIVVSLE